VLRWQREKGGALCPVHVTGEARLYEGTACDTPDREDSEGIDLTLAATPPGSAALIDMHLDNSGVGGDTANIDLQVVNGL
jgi:hypothetical protein